MKKIKIESFLQVISLATLVILYSNLLGLCVFSVYCNSYVPTLSYLASFRTYDTVVVLALTMFAFAMIPVFISWHLLTQQLLATDELVFMVILELGIIVLSITVGLVDEINGVEFNPVYNLHVFFSFTLCLVIIIWVYYALNFLEISKAERIDRKSLTSCWLLYKIGLILFGITLYEWHFAYTIYSNIFTNIVVESIFEWTLITLTIRFPYHFCKAMNMCFTFTAENKLKY